MQPHECDRAFGVWLAARTARTGPPSQRRSERVRVKLSEPGTTVHVADDGAIVAMVASEAGRAEDGTGAVLPRALHVSMVFVAPAAQRRGVGSRLLCHVFTAAAARGLSSAALWTETTNSNARRLYERVGMVATRERQVSETMRWVRYELTLDT